MTPSMDFQQAARPAVSSPVTRAAASALLYVVFCTAYIFISGRFAANVSSDTEQLRTIETLKGTIFVVVTGLMFFALSLMRWRRIRRQEETIMQQEKSLLISERKAVATMFAASLSHDLNNLLMSLSMLTGELKDRERNDPEIAALRSHLDKGITSLAHISKRIVAASKLGGMETESEVDLTEMLQRLVALMSKHPDLQSCSIDLNGVFPVTIRANIALLEEAVINLLVNAGQATGANGRIAIRMRHDNGMVSLEIHDSGPGIPAGLAEEIFDPCFTTKPNGTGLGLLAVKAFSSSCGGSVVVDRSDLGGAMFALRIPESRATTRS